MVVYVKKTKALKSKSLSIKFGQEESVDAPSFKDRIEKKAYEFFEQRGSAHGHDWEDWFEAEKRVVAHTSNIDKDCIRSEQFYEVSHHFTQLPAEMEVKKNNDHFIG